MEPIPFVILSTIVLGVLCAYRFIIYPGFLSPLAKIPNAHFLAPYTSLWMVWNRWRQCEISTICAAHQKFGDLVRLAPDELSIGNYNNGVRIAYNSSPNWAKPCFVLDLFPNYGIKNMFTTHESKAHSERRRMFGSIYSKSYLSTSQNMQKLARNIVFERFLPVIQKAAIQGGSSEVPELMGALAMDFVTGHIYGTAAGTDFISNVDYRKHWFEMYRLSQKYYVPFGQYTPQVLWLQSKLGINVIPAAIYRAYHGLEEWNLSLFKNAESLEVSSDDSDRSTEPATCSILRSALEKSQRSVQITTDLSPCLRLVIASELLDHIFAGYDTVSTTLTYILYEMSRNTKLQARLRSEVRSSLPELGYSSKRPCLMDNLLDWRLLDRLTILDRVVQETVRRWPPVGTGMYRVTPKQPSTLCGYEDIPGGVRVSSVPHVLHRNEEVFSVRNGSDGTSGWRVATDIRTDR